MGRARTIVLLLCAASSSVAAAPGGDDWKYDVLTRKGGEVLRGLVVGQDARSFKIRVILRRPGSPTVVFPLTVPRSDLIGQDLLTGPDRTLLEQRLEALKRERQDLADRLRLLDPKSSTGPRPADALDLHRVPWPIDDKVQALSYHSTYFHLVANCRPELVQLAAIHLEQVYAAYARSLPPRTPRGTPTTILLTRSLAEYQAIARQRKLNLFNPAFYDPRRNQVVCGSDLERLFDEMEKVRAHHVQLRAQMKERKGELARVYRGKIPATLLAPLHDADKRIDQVEKANDKAYRAARDRLFPRLYHEAFHAYLNTFVYPAVQGALPHWFNEGLAQIFETAIVEVGELRVGHADPERLRAVRGSLMPLTDLLRAKPEQFLVAHASDKQASDRCYLASWALAFHLTFEKRLLGTKALDDYVHALRRGTDPLLAFRDLVGKPLPQFEKEYLEYLRKLRPDGQVGK
jgi:hypothetical protein